MARRSLNEEFMTLDVRTLLVASLALLTLPQVAEAQDPRQKELADSIEKYIKGDDGERPTILSAGILAMRPLRERRREARARDVLEELRLAIASPDDRRAAKKFSVNGSIQGKSLNECVAVIGFSTDVPILVDPADTETGARVVNIQLRGERPIAAVCEQLDIDFAYLYGAIVLAKTSRLWPTELPGLPPLDPRDRQSAVDLIPKLGAGAVAEREQASKELKKLGPSIIPVLAQGAGDRDPEVAARCRDLINLLRPIPRGAFGRPGAERQVLSGMDQELYDKLKSLNPAEYVEASRAEAAAFLKEILSPHGIEFRCDLKGAKVSGAFRPTPLWTILATVTQSHDLDFLIEGGKVICDSRAEIDKRLRSK